jgi:hypothetical protein
VQCRKCGNSLDYDNWYKSHREKHTYICKNCWRAYERKRYEKHLVQPDGKRSCRICGIVLTEENWTISNRRAGSKICRKCDAKKSSEYYYRRCNDKDWILQRNKAWKINRRKTKYEVFTHYSGNPPYCKCCGEKTFEFLTIDHINGREPDDTKVGEKLYVWLKHNHYPQGYQILCWNCNLSKGLFGYCPHKQGNISTLTLDS